MRDILITSSVLILALLVLRQVFRKTISRRMQYALWGLVLLRLLVPASLPAMEHNVLTTAEPVQTTVSQQVDSVSVYLTPVAQGKLAKSAVLPPDSSTPAVVVRNSRSETVTEHDYTVQGQPADAAIMSEDGTITWYAKALPLNTLLTYIWCIGIAVMACWLVISNLHFWRKLRKARVPYSVENCRYPVYLVESGLPSPCLFGLFRPAIYLTPAAAATPESLRHVLAHETTHARHLDPLWSLLRSVCLAVYWFNPLVWIAAAVSKTDCELACDEGALRRLGEAERVAYGRTLLALIPVTRKPANPLLSATTMTAGKRQLKDRITRIAENRQTRTAALFLVVALAAVVCTATFTGAKSPVEQSFRPLTGEELAYFNKEFFNKIVDTQQTLNIRNQFLSSLYEKPEEIDLYELFYCGIPYGEVNVTNKADISLGWAEVLERDYGGVEPDCATYALSTTDMDALLGKYTGLTVAKTNGVGLEHFSYLQEYDAYYWAHGDTNYRGNVTITAGERTDDTVRLYYEDTYFGDGWKRVTLRETENGYHFVSNQLSEKPAIPTVLPERDPVLTIPLTELAPYEPETAAVERHRDDCVQWLGGWSISAEDGSNVIIRPYLSTDGNLYAAILHDAVASSGQMLAWDVDCFLTFPENNSITDGEISINASFFSDLFGHDGWQISYRGQLSEHHWTTFTDYYYFEDRQTPVLLAHTHGLNSQIIDLDGDGTNELINEDNQLFFQRDGKLYQADITALLQKHWPELNWWDYSILDTNSRCLMVKGFVEMPDWDATSWGETALADFFRYVYYDGENLLVYDDLEETEDHAAVSVLSSGIPEQVLADGKAQAQAAYEACKGAEWDYHYDDWRVSYLSKIDTYTEFGDLTIEVYGLGYQFHTAEPSAVMLAGGMYLQEDGWVGGLSMEESPYLVYQRKEDGTRIRLDSEIDGDCSTNSLAYRGGLCETLLVNGLLQPSGIPARDLLVMFYMGSPASFLNEMAAYPEREQAAVFSTLAAFQNGGEEDAQLLQEALQTLEWTLRDLTEQGQTAYGRLQAALHGSLDVKPLLESLETSDRVSMTLTTASGVGGGRYTGAPRTGNSRQRVNSAIQDYDWIQAANAQIPTGVDTLVIESGDGTLALQFWAGSDLVCCTQNDTAVWYQAVSNQVDDVFATDIFSMIRIWYDEMEWRAMTANIVIPDQGQDRLEIAQAWVDQYEGTKLQVTRGSKYADTYFRAEDVQLSDVITEDDPEWDPPAPITDELWFLFSYTGIFVPENPVSMQWSMAGNTEEYDGTYGEAPEDALSYSRCGYMYLTETGWRCDAIGTGP